jgi:putative peptidoglycan lipid II flippase
MLASLLSYIAGFLRDRTLSHFFGASQFTDAYNASFLIPDFLFNMFIAGALSVAFIPVFTSFLKTSEEKALEIANTIITFSLILLGFLALVFFFISPLIIHAIFYNLSLEEQNLIITMTRIMLLSPLIFAVSNTLGSVLITHKHFMAYALSGFLYNMGIIGGIFVLHESLGIYGASIGAIFGALLHLMIRILDTKTISFKFKIQLKLAHEGVRKIFKLMIPKTIGLLSWQANLWVYTITAYTLTEGSVAAFNFARNMQSFPVSLFGISLATAIFPFLAEYAHNKDIKKFSEHFQSFFEKILFFSIPASFGILIMNREIIEIILRGGAFGEEAVLLTSTALYFFAFTIPFESCIHLFARGFYAFKNTFTPMIFSVIGVFVNAFIAFKFAQTYGIKILPIAMTITFIIQLTLLIIFFSKRLRNFEFSKFFFKLGKIFVSVAFMSLMLFIFKFEGSLISQFLRIIIGAFSYLFIAFILRCDEIEYAKNMLLRKFKNNASKT